MSFSRQIEGAGAFVPDEAVGRSDLASEDRRNAGYHGMSDEDLLEMMRADDEVAYRILITRHVYRCQRLAIRVLHDNSLAEDIVQDVFLQLWIRRADWRRTNAKFTSWLFRAIFNRCIDVRRKRRDVALETTDEPADLQADAVTRIYQSHVMRRLREAMTRLPSSQYVALFLSYHEGYSIKDTASAMGISASAVESLLKRGRQNLRDQLKRDRLNVQQAFPDS